ncbi:MAG TPA: OmpA family protein [Kofleriaceae bacterium]|nr:OmpA family protein [Kofleriaceae bacterium]
MFRPTLVAALAAGGVGLVAPSAQANVEVGGTAGVHVFSDTNELGVNDVANAPSERNSALFGLRLGVFFGNLLGVEGEFGVIPSESRDQVFDVWNITYRAHLVAQFGKPESKLVPFVLVGGGAFQVVNSKGEDKGADAIVKDTDGLLYAGIGAKYRVDNGWGLRLDARILFPPASVDGDNMPTDSFTQDYEALLSIYKEFGRPKPPKKEEPPPPDNDPDKDGIVGDADKCPTEAEDKDSFQDDDGCPDPDNDGDGVADASDKCPMEPEDKDSFQDDDGCPDPDNDADGIPDAADKCPTEAEDKDSFQDDDGCPDPDNDNDGVLDPQDKCPDQPETKNGYQDEDGCADEIPAKVKQFTGVIQGINFKTGDATLLPTSNKTLDKAVAVLKEYPDLKMEIQGHTDDQPLKAKAGAQYQDNQSLSQGRADTVKAYFVGKGIEESRLTAKGYADTKPVVDPTGLKGAKLNAARAKNRRVEFQLVSPLGDTSGTATPPAPGTGTTPPAGTGTPPAGTGTTPPAGAGSGSGSATPPADQPKPKK